MRFLCTEFPLLPLLKLLCLFYLTTSKHKLLEMLVILTLSICCWSWETNYFQLSVYKLALKYISIDSPVGRGVFLNLKTVIIWNLREKLIICFFKAIHKGNKEWTWRIERPQGQKNGCWFFSCVFFKSGVYYILTNHVFFHALLK